MKRITTQRVISLSQRLSVSIASDKADFEAVGALRYACYRREDYTPEHPDKALIDRFDGLLEHPTFMVLDESGLVASIRTSLLFDQQSSSPSMISFSNEIECLMDEGPIVDPNRFVIDNYASRFYSDLHLFVLTIPFSVAAISQCSYVLASVRPEHRAFYARKLGYREIAGPRPYHGLSCELGLMSVNYRNEHLSVIRRHPFFGEDFKYRAVFAKEWEKLSELSQVGAKTSH